jgi:hypothetical protein
MGPRLAARISSSSLVHGGVLEEEIKHGAHCNCCGVRSGNESNQQVANDCSMANGVRVRRFGFQEVLQEIGNLGVETLVFSLEPSSQALQGDTSLLPHVRWTYSHQRVLIQ